MPWFQQLRDRAHSEQQRPHVLTTVGGGDAHARVLLCAHGARILAVQLPGVDHNVLFTATGGDGKLTGGDRLWLAPEVGWFWPSLAEARRDPKSTAATPAEVDPAQYAPLSSSDTHVELRDPHVVVRDVRDGKGVAVALTRRFDLIGPPAAHADGLTTLSFRITNTITAAGGDRADAGAVAGCWDILQVPPTGTIICPTTTRAAVRSYYDPFGDRHVAVDDQRVRFLVDSKRRIKMGLLAEHTTGRLAYFRQLDGGRATLILRVFAPQPGDPYCDIPRDAPDTQRLGGDALQAYNDDGDAFPGSPGFGEMEYHDPCLIIGREPGARTGSSVTHVLAGPAAAVRAAGAALLGAPIDPIRSGE